MLDSQSPAGQPYVRALAGFAACAGYTSISSNHRGAWRRFTIRSSIGQKPSHAAWFVLMIDNFTAEWPLFCLHGQNSPVFMLLAPRLLKGPQMKQSILSSPGQNQFHFIHMKRILLSLTLVGIVACSLAGFAQTTPPAGDAAAASATTSPGCGPAGTRRRTQRPRRQPRAAGRHAARRQRRSPGRLPRSPPRPRRPKLRPHLPTAAMPAPTRPSRAPSFL